MNRRQTIFVVIFIVATALLAVVGLIRLKNHADKNMAVFYQDLRDSRTMGLLNADRAALSDLLPPRTRQVVWSAIDSKYYIAATDTKDATLSQMFTMTNKGEIKNLPEDAGVKGERTKPHSLSGVAYHERFKKVYFVTDEKDGEHIVFDPQSGEMDALPVRDSSGSSIVYHKKSDKLYVLNFPYLLQLDEEDMEPDRYLNLQEPKSTFEAFPRDGYDEQFTNLKPQDYPTAFVLYDNGDEIAAAESFANGRERLNNLSLYEKSSAVGMAKVQVYKVNRDENQVLYEVLPTQ